MRFSGAADKAAAVYANTQPLGPGDVAEAVLWAAAQPPHVNINVIELMPVVQSFAPFRIQRSQTATMWARVHKVDRVRPQPNGGAIILIEDERGVPMMTRVPSLSTLTAIARVLDAKQVLEAKYDGKGEVGTRPRRRCRASWRRRCRARARISDRTGETIVQMAQPASVEATVDVAILGPRALHARQHGHRGPREHVEARRGRTAESRPSIARSTPSNTGRRCSSWRPSRASSRRAAGDGFRSTNAGAVRDEIPRRKNRSPDDGRAEAGRGRSRRLRLDERFKDRGEQLRRLERRDDDRQVDGCAVKHTNTSTFASRALSRASPGSVASTTL